MARHDSGAEYPNENSHHGPYGITGRGINSQGNTWVSRSFANDPSAPSYRYSNEDGSWYYRNPDGSTYHDNGQGIAKYTSPTGNEVRYDRRTPPDATSEHWESVRGSTPSHPYSDRASSSEDLWSKDQVERNDSQAYGSPGNGIGNGAGHGSEEDTPRDEYEHEKDSEESYLDGEDDCENDDGGNGSVEVDNDSNDDEDNDDGEADSDSNDDPLDDDPDDDFEDDYDGDGYDDDSYDEGSDDDYD